jgi:site-specific recombinase XerD
MAAPSVDDLAPSFERYLRAGNTSSRTIETYLEAVRGFAAHLAGTSGRALDQARREDVEAWIGVLLGRWKPATAHNRCRGLHALYRWLEEEYDLPSPMAKMKSPAVPDQPVPVLTEPQLRALFGVCAGKDFEARRDTALLMVLLDAGPRRAELLGMRLEDLDFGYDPVRVVGKGGRERALPFGPRTALALDCYLRARSRHRLAHLDALWLSQRGALTISGLRDLLDRRARQAGIPDLHPHMFRHSFAHEWLSAGALGDRPAVLSWQVRQLPAHERPGPPRRSTRQPGQQPGPSTPTNRWGRRDGWSARRDRRRSPRA